VVSVIEATLEDPRPVLNAQQFKARGEAVAEMKADGIEYDERMDLLEEVSWPKPLQELLEHTYEVYRRTHPWIAESALSPKSVVRDMYERAMTFGEYVAFYGLARSEGIVLRYLGDSYKALRQTVPESMKDDALTDLIEWLGETVRQTDSSLLDEWEQLSHPAEDPESAVDLVRAHARPAQARPITANERSFRVLVRNALFRRVELAARRRYDELGELDAGAGMDAEAWREAVEAYFKEHDSIDTGPDARGPHMIVLEQEGRTWRVQQIVGDPEGDHDWRIVAEVDLDASDEAAELVLEVGGLVQL
jgi:superfamily II RNA helicase